MNKTIRQNAQKALLHFEMVINRTKDYNLIQDFYNELWDGFNDYGFNDLLKELDNLYNQRINEIEQGI